jgi:virginiamycin B lyase
MRKAASWLAAIGSGALILGFVLAQSRPAASQAPSALAGSVSSAEEGMMEGVLVSARKDGSTIATTVVSDNQGRYSFPAGRLGPGHYALSIRAAGYDLAGSRSAELEAGKTAAADLKLVKTKNLAAQLSNAEWIASVPGTDRQRALLTNCVGCHTVQRVLMSTHDSAEFMSLLTRMAGYSPGTTPLKPQLWVGPSPRGFGPRQQEAADYFATINLSNVETWEYPLKTLPRPKGRATRVIVTEYDLPRKEAMPHDVVLDADGMPWYSDFGSLFIGQLDPKTGKVTDHALPLLRPDEPTGTLQIDSDPNGNLWVAMMLQGGVARFDRKEKKFDVFPVPKDWLSDRTQESMIAPYSAQVDGTVYTNNQARHEIYRVDLKTGEYTNLGAMRDAKGTLIDAYGMPADHDNNLYLLEFQGTHIGRYEAKTKTVKIYATPTPSSRPRRGRVDDENNLWFAEYGGNAIGKFDPRTEQITEWKLPTPHSDPYDVVRAKNGEVWAGSMVTDQVDRLDPATGAITEYLLPRHTNIRRVFLDNSVNPPVLWVGNNHGASIVKIEPLD